jgi:hypothetical protein
LKERGHSKAFRKFKWKWSTEENLIILWPYWPVFQIDNVCLIEMWHHRARLLYVVPVFCSPRRISPTDPSQHRSPRSMHEILYSRHSRDDNNGSDDDDEDDVFMSNQRHSAHLRSPVDAYLSEDDARVMRRATKVLMYVKTWWIQIYTTSRNYCRFVQLSNFTMLSHFLLTLLISKYFLIYNNLMTWINILILM